MAILAKYNGRCPTCGDKIEEGEHEISQDTDGSWHHVECIGDDHDDEKFARNNREAARKHASNR